MMKEIVFKSYSKRYKTNDRVIDEVTDNDILRNILNIGAFFQGVFPIRCRATGSICSLEEPMAK